MRQKEIDNNNKNKKVFVRLKPLKAKTGAVNHLFILKS